MFIKICYNVNNLIEPKMKNSIFFQKRNFLFKKVERPTPEGGRLIDRVQRSGAGDESGSPYKEELKQRYASPMPEEIIQEELGGGMTAKEIVDQVTDFDDFNKFLDQLSQRLFEAAREFYGNPMSLEVTDMIVDELIQKIPEGERKKVFEQIVQTYSDKGIEFKPSLFFENEKLGDYVFFIDRLVEKYFDEVYIDSIVFDKTLYVGLRIVAVQYTKNKDLLRKIVLDENESYDLRMKALDRVADEDIYEDLLINANGRSHLASAAIGRTKNVVLLKKILLEGSSLEIIFTDKGVGRFIEC